LPKKICEATQISKGSELKVFVERGDLILRQPNLKTMARGLI
jgi:hypothetical protein|tara:strand:+ start:194 stop:319 length:126 start_codon:yes stop_codon:yes gene_type:complete